MFEALLHNVLSQVKIVDVLRKMGYHLSHGESTQQIRCPFHDDRTPSARVYSDTQRLYCYTCGRGWDAVQLVVGKTHLSTEQALYYLEQEFRLTPLSENLTSSIQGVLTQKPSVRNIDVLFNVAEQALIESRFDLGFESYCRLLDALDGVTFRVKSGQMPFEQGSAILRGNLRRCCARQSV